MKNRGSGDRDYRTGDYSANDWQGSASSEYDDDDDSTRSERKRWYQNEDDYDTDRRRRDERPSRSSYSDWDSGGKGTSSVRDAHDYDERAGQHRRYDSRRGSIGREEEGRRPSRRSYYEDRMIDVDRHGDDDDYILSRRTGGGWDSSSGGNQVVCVDGSRSSDRAVRFALENVPKQRKLLLIHGIYSPITSRTEDHEPELRRMENKYLDMCRFAGRDCTFVPFEYSRNRSFSEGVCHFARANRSPSIIMGKRDDVSTLRRSLMGSSTSMVMSDCEVPVTIALGRKSQQS